MKIKTHDDLATKILNYIKKNKDTIHLGSLRSVRALTMPINSEEIYVSMYRFNGFFAPDYYLSVSNIDKKGTYGSTIELTVSRSIKKELFKLLDEIDERLEREKVQKVKEDIEKITNKVNKL